MKDKHFELSDFITNRYHIASAHSRYLNRQKRYVLRLQDDSGWYSEQVSCRTLNMLTTTLMFLGLQS
jgi:hypothetical protein